jgi:hypothetical protein
MEPGHGHEPGVAVEPVKERLAAAVAVLLVLWGCGHRVEPTEGYEDPASLPLPQDLRVFLQNRRADLVWTAPDEDFRVIDGWNIYRALGGAPPAAGDYLRLNGAVHNATRSYVDTNLVDGTTYWYRLTSVSAAGVESFPTETVSVRADFAPPASPTAVAASAGPVSVSVTWTGPPDPDVAHFNVFRTPPVPPLIYFDIPPEVTLFTDTFALVAGDTLSYWVTAVDGALNESAPSETVRVVIPAAGFQGEDP